MHLFAAINALSLYRYLTSPSPLGLVDEILHSSAFLNLIGPETQGESPALSILAVCTLFLFSLPNFAGAIEIGGSFSKPN
jgi:hypothetical protein